MNYTVVLNATSFDPWSMINQESLYNKGKFKDFLKLIQRLLDLNIQTSTEWDNGRQDKRVTYSDGGT